MPLLNYTTTIDAAKTVYEIQGILAYHGASSILVQYGQNGVIEALSFKVNTPMGEVAIRLPVDPDAVLKVMMRHNNTNTKRVPRHLLTRQQAIRVAWRIVKDWVEAQMAILETEMVKMEQIFLPYVISRDGKTLYEVFQDKQLLLTEGLNENH